MTLLTSENAFIAKAVWFPGTVCIRAGQLMFQELLCVPVGVQHTSRDGWLFQQAELPSVPMKPHCRSGEKSILWKFCLLGISFADEVVRGFFSLKAYIYIYLYLSFAGFPFSSQLSLRCCSCSSVWLFFPLRKFSNINLILTLTTASIPQGTLPPRKCSLLAASSFSSLKTSFSHS